MSAGTQSVKNVEIVSGEAGARSIAGSGDHPLPALIHDSPMKPSAAGVSDQCWACGENLGLNKFKCKVCQTWQGWRRFNQELSIVVSLITALAFVGSILGYFMPELKGARVEADQLDQGIGFQQSTMTLIEKKHDDLKQMLEDESPSLHFARGDGKTAAQEAAKLIDAASKAELQNLTNIAATATLISENDAMNVNKGLVDPNLTAENEAKIRSFLKEATDQETPAKVAQVKAFLAEAKKP
jgi:hypothetical protein